MDAYGFIGTEEQLQQHQQAMAGRARITHRVTSIAGDSDGVARFETLDAMLTSGKDLQAVIIASETGYHAEAIIKSLQARKHVVCEAPLCITIAAAWQIIETAKFCRRNVWICNTIRQSNFIRELEKASIQQFSLQCLLPHAAGKAVFPHGGALYEAHALIDSLVASFGPVKAAEAFIHGLGQRRDTGGVAIVQFENGVAGTINWIASDQPGYRLSSGSSEWNMPFADNNHQNQLLQDFYSTLFEAGEQSKNRLPGVYDGMHTVTLLDKIYQSAATEEN